MTTRLMCGLATLALLAGCDESPLAPSAATEATWRLVAIERAGTPPVEVPDPGRYTLRLDPAGRLSLRADCNTCGGTYTLNGDTLTVGNALACTRAFCGTASLDTVFLSAFAGSPTLTVAAGDLAVRGNGVTLRFRR